MEQGVFYSYVYVLFLREFDGSLELTEGWARNVLKSMDWVKRKGTTGKVEPCSKFLEEEKFTFQRAIAKAVSDHDIPMELVLAKPGSNPPVLCFPWEIYI